MLKRILFIAALFLMVVHVQAQDDLLDLLEDEQGETTEYAFATFKGTRAINLQSTELPSKGVLQYIFMHRFGSFSDDFFYNNCSTKIEEVIIGIIKDSVTFSNISRFISICK